MADLRIRDATSLDHATFVRLFAELGVDDPPMPQVRFDHEMLGDRSGSSGRSPVPMTFFAERDGAVVGYAYLRVIGESGHVGNLVTDPAARRTGVGAALMREAMARLEARGCKVASLNVKSDNAAAIALYRSFGFEPVFASHNLRIAWGAFDAPWLSAARIIDPADDDRFERTLELPPSTLAVQRAKPGQVLVAIDRGADGFALASFAPAFPGTSIFRATDVAHALSLLAALRPHARPEDDGLFITIENDAAQAAELLARCATLRFEMLRMRSAIPSVER